MIGLARWGFAGAAAACLTLCAGAAFATPRARVSILPPARPHALDIRMDVQTTGSTAEASQDDGDDDTPLPITPAAAGDKLDERSAIQRADAALNGIQTMTARFTQIGGDSREATGILYLQRPGKLRFEYDKPSTMEVVSDGSTVLVRDRKLNTSDPYPISQTPLKFLLDTKIDLRREAKITGVSSQPGGVRIAIEDSTTLGGTSKISLGFDPDVTTLKRWTVLDPQGYTTTVTLSNIEKNKPIDPHVFMLNYMRPVE